MNTGRAWGVLQSLVGVSALALGGCHAGDEAIAGGIGQVSDERAFADLGGERDGEERVFADPGGEPGGEAALVGCQKLIGATSVPAAQVRGAVPESLAILGEEQGVAHVVFSVYECESMVVGERDQPTAASQVGVQIVSPDGTGTLNAYTLAHTTTNPALAAALRSTGATAMVVSEQELTESFAADGAVESFASVRRPFRSPLAMHAVGAGVGAPLPDFVASWWQMTDHGLSRTRFTSPLVQLGFCAGDVYVKPHSALARIVGSVRAPLDAICVQASIDGALTDITLL